MLTELGWLMKLFRAARRNPLVALAENCKFDRAKILRRRLRLHAYKIQTLQALELDDGNHRNEYVVDMLGSIVSDSGFLDRVTFNDGPAPGKQTQLQNLEFTNTNVIASS
jgi:hypothetical protein